MATGCSVMAYTILYCQPEHVERYKKLMDIEVE